MKHGNIALFVPHNGCPNQCTFCNQRSITGKQYQPTAEDVDRAVLEAVLSSERNGTKYNYEIAFFGGSFTAIDREYMLTMLNAAHKYVENGTVGGIRLSTRPDAIDNEVLTLLKNYGVTSIELGAQSMCDDVLLANLRGHTSDDVRNASCLIKNYGFSLGLQMMTGLYKSDNEKDIFTAKEIIGLEPDTVRIYPTITIEGTMLGELYKSGEYKPSSLDESVDLCALLLKMFSENNIEVIRLGLHYSEDLKNGMLFDNYHPAFKELCESRLMLDEFVRSLEFSEILKKGTKDIVVAVNPSSVSKFVGQKRANIKTINRMGLNVKIRQNDKLSVYELLINDIVNE